MDLGVWGHASRKIFIRKVYKQVDMYSILEIQFLLVHRLMNIIMCVKDQIHLHKEEQIWLRRSRRDT